MPVIENTLQDLLDKVADIQLLELEMSGLEILARYPTILEGTEVFVSVSVPAVSTIGIQSIALKNLFTPSEIVSKAVVRRAIVQAQLDLLLENQGEINFPNE